jgi:outer membrane protein assembly factor BamB
MVTIIILASGVWILLRTDGITGDFSLDLAWRWAETSEERLLAQEDGVSLERTTTAIEIEAVVEWPGFRGPNRDGIINGVKIQTDWSTTPPKELWRRPIGPGCSSFAIGSDYLYTQEQRGDDEIVACYNMNTGEPVWRHHDKARFWDSHAGAGPRSTPTLSNGRVYSLGATGILNVLEASDGTAVWSRNVVSDTEVEHSGWGYTSSPLVVENLVIVAVVGQLVAYDIATGEPRWFGPDGGDSYSSPHLLTIDGITQILLLSGSGATSIAPSEGTLLWEYSWPGDSRIVQPAITNDGDILICKGDGAALRRIMVVHKNDEWTFEERWTSVQIKPNFNDFILHKGHAYGYSGPLLVCIDVKDGERKWRGGRLGGQIILLADQDLLLVLSEKGELVLVKATPDKFKELARLEAIEGKTWNHPAIAGNVLLVRNAQEMAAYRILPKDKEENL